MGNRHQGGNNRLTLEALKIHASKNGGLCLSTDYSGVAAKYKFQCKHGHEWETRAQNVLHKNRWCPTCGKQFYVEHTLSTFQALAINKGGICLSTDYGGIRAKLDFRCRFGHEFSAKAGSILHSQSWCRFCSRPANSIFKKKDPESELARMQSLAKAKLGLCISKTYLSDKIKLLFECGDGHRWETRPNLIKRGTWCPLCAKGKHKQIFEIENT